MGKIEWSMWANEQALVSSAICILGGILAVAGQFSNWQFGAYAIAVAVLVAVLEYPKGKRAKGKSAERVFQFCFTIIVKQGRLLTRNYFVRFVFYLLISIACCFHLSTILGGICFMITSLIYLVAALKGEEWIPIENETEESGPKVIPQPKNPPPRRPPNLSPHSNQL